MSEVNVLIQLGENYMFGKFIYPGNPAPQTEQIINNYIRKKAVGAFVNKPGKSGVTINLKNKRPSMRLRIKDFLQEVNKVKAARIKGKQIQKKLV